MSREVVLEEQIREAMRGPKIVEELPKDLFLPIVVREPAVAMYQIQPGISMPHINSWDFVGPQDDFLTIGEINDVEASWKQIEEGQAKKFTSIEDFLAELKE